MDANAHPPLTIADWRDAVLRGADVLEWVRERARRIAASSPAEAWILRLDEAALAERLSALQALARSVGDPAECLRRWPLFGVPFAVKDNIDVAGLPTTAACPAAATVPAAHATVVRRLLDAGAVLMGKTNLDQFATGLVGTRSPAGAPASTWSAERISGGSSSGSAVVVARGDVAFALGTDTAGSGRIPAGFNHVVGVKPTSGRVSTSGVLPACRSLDCVSIFTLDVDDGARVLALIEGPDESDAYSAFRTGPADWTGRALRVGVPSSPSFGRTAGYPAAWGQALARLDALGAVTVPVDFAPLADVAALLYDGPWVAERLVVLEDLLRDRPEVIDPAVREVVARGRSFSAVDAFRGQYALQAKRRALEALWRDVDLLLVPTAPEHPSFADVAAEPIGANARLGAYTNFVNLLGWCAVALPSGITTEGLPFGVTGIAPGAHDAALLGFARRWQSLAREPMGATGRRPVAGTEAIPAPGPASRPTLPLVVVGAHLSGQPLNGQLIERGAMLLQATHTAPRYRLFALAGTVPPKPGLQRVAEGGVAIEVEVWSMPIEQAGSFLQLVPPPLALGSIELADGSWCHGFVCEPVGLVGAVDISAHGGWRGFLAARAALERGAPAARPPTPDLTPGAQAHPHHLPTSLKE